jgi:hypothetical protein
VRETGKVVAKDATIKASGTDTGRASCIRYRDRKVATVRNA